MKQKRLQKGFTLIEILVVIVIIGILATIGMGSFQSSQLKSRDSKRKGDLKHIGEALEMYYNDYEQYPVDNAGQIDIDDGAGGTVTISWGDEFVDSNGTIYMSQLPAETSNGISYYYESADGSSFQLYARLENGNDRDIPTVLGDPAYYDGTTCGTANCNYGISSSNTGPEDGHTPLAE